MRREQSGQWWTADTPRRRCVVGALLAVGLTSCRGDSSSARLPQSTDRAGVPATGSGTVAGGGAESAGVPLGRKRVVLLGTSLTAGLGLDPDKAYPALLQRKADSAGLAVSIVAAGVSGETSAGARRRAGWVLEQMADAVVLEVGANDGLRGVDPDSTRVNILALVETVRAKQPSARILLVQMEAPTNLGRDYTSRFHDAYVRAAQESGVPLLPFLLRGVAGDARYNQADGIHPNPVGSVVVANTMWDALFPTLQALLTPAVPPR